MTEIILRIEVQEMEREEIDKELHDNINQVSTRITVPSFLFMPPNMQRS